MHRETIPYPRRGSVALAVFVGAIAIAVTTVGFFVYSGTWAVPDDPGVRIELPAGVEDGTQPGSTTGN